MLSNERSWPEGGEQGVWMQRTRRRRLACSIVAWIADLIASWSSRDGKEHVSKGLTCKSHLVTVQSTPHHTTPYNVTLHRIALYCIYQGKCHGEYQG
jgi:hypothetical protein